MNAGNKNRFINIGKIAKRNLIISKNIYVDKENILSEYICTLETLILNLKMPLSFWCCLLLPISFISPRN